RELPALSIYKAPFVVVAMYGASVGNTSLSAIDACMNQACCLVRGRDGVRDEFLFYVISSSQPDLISKAQGGTQPNISQMLVKNHSVPFPPQDEQEKIIAFLAERVKNLDELRTLKFEQLSILEKQRQSLIFEYVTGKRRASEAS